MFLAASAASASGPLHWPSLAVTTAYGPLTVCGTYLVQRGPVESRLIWASVSLGLLIAAFLWANEFPDYRADGASGKRTWVVCLGRPTAAKVFTGILLAAFALVPVSQGWGGLVSRLAFDGKRCLSLVAASAVHGANHSGANAYLGSLRPLRPRHRILLALLLNATARLSVS